MTLNGLKVVWLDRSELGDDPPAIHYRVFDNSVQCDFSGLLPEPR
jgi:hypothetical protein